MHATTIVFLVVMVAFFLLMVVGNWFQKNRGWELALRTTRLNSYIAFIGMLTIYLLHMFGGK